MTPEEKELLLRFSINDATVMLNAVAVGSSSISPNDRIAALNQIAALIASGSSVSSYQRVVDDAIASGASESDIVGVLLTVAPIVGLARVACAAPRLALALGYDVEGALE